MLTAYMMVIPGTGMIMKMDMWATIDEQLHEHSPEIGEIVQWLVKQKTPVDTGALMGDVTYDAYLDTGDADIAWITTNTGEQIAAWNRIYVAYQEGPPMGLDTYTNLPRLMFMRTSEEDGPPAVEIWGVVHVQEALDMCAAGAGIPL